MKNPVIAIGMDSAEASLIERWTAEGKLPTLAKLKAGGAYGRTQGNDVAYSEVAWPSFYTGCWPEKTGFWQHVAFDPESYSCRLTICDYEQTPPFYALGKDYRVAAFDLPQVKMSDDVNGVQVLGWGAHSPFTPTVSKPADVLEKIKAKYGLHPTLHRDHARPWRKTSVGKLMSRSLEGIELRRKINRELFQQENWNLYLTVFSEVHGAAHYAWHVSQEDHPLHKDFANMFGGKDPVLELYQATDRAIGDLLEAAPEGTRVVVFSQEGMNNNNLDLPNMAFLPEILYRMYFPGKIGLAQAEGGPNTPAPDPVLWPLNLGWVRSVYKTKADDNALRRFIRQNVLMEAGYKIEKTIFGEAEGPQYPYNVKPYWCPGMWYSHMWHKMRAFAFPAQGDGLVRINLQGREKHGLVPLDEYHAEIQAITDQMMQLRDPRTNKPCVLKVMRTRTDEQIMATNASAADLVVKWDPEVIIDVIDSPTLGRFGPLACRRSGGHTNGGFFIANGADIPAGLQVTDATWVDVPAMILDFMGAPIPERMDGHSPIRRARHAA